MTNFPPTVPHRQIYWNIPEHALLYIPFAVMAVIFCYGIYRHVRMWQLGKAVPLGPIGPRLRRVLMHGIFQARVARKKGPGTAHLVLFLAYGFLTVGTIAIALQTDLGLPIVQGPFYLWFESFALDVAGTAATFAVAAFLLRRYGMRAKELRREPMDFWLPFSLLIVLVTGFVLQSLRIYATHDPWAAYSPVGNLLAHLWSSLGLSIAEARAIHHALWWFHLFVAFAFMASWPYSKLMHILYAPLAIFLSDPSEQPMPPKVSFEGEGRLGANFLADLTVKDLVDLDACTECGRCEEVCPAFASGKPLSPRQFILDLRRHMHATPDQPLTDTIRDETLFACTTCRACMEACPVDIEHVPKILALRQYRVMEEGAALGGLGEALAGMETRGHPFRGVTATRASWYADLPGVRTWRPGEPVELLLWVGCAVAFDPRAQQVARSLAQLMLYMGEDFRVLGEAEVCTGDVARRAGQEYLYDLMAQEAVGRLQEVQPKRVVTPCPHCLYQMKVEYRRYGLAIEVVHHTAYLAEALKSGRLQVPSAAVSTTYHDPCYLGRYGRVFEEPRFLVRQVGDLREMPRNRSRSFCCGGGGGHAFSEEEGERINRLRAREALATGASVVATACPFCLQMMTDGVKAEGGSGEVVQDIAEILWSRLVASGKANAEAATLRAGADVSKE